MDEDRIHHRRGASSDDSVRARTLTILLFVVIGIFLVLMYLLIR